MTASLDHLETALDRIKDRDMKQASLEARESLRFAEEAFSNPSMASKENFPFEHRLGIYVPLLVPLTVSTIVACVNQVNRFWKGN